MGAYKYVCEHEDCEKIAEGIRKCKFCGMVIITDRGVFSITVEWEEFASR